MLAQRNPIKLMFAYAVLNKPTTIIKLEEQIKKFIVFLLYAIGGLIGVLVFTTELAAQDIKSGRVCLAPLPILDKGQETPWKIVNNKNETNYSVQINDKAPVRLSTTKVHWVPDLDLDKFHQAVVLIDEKKAESFNFTIEAKSLRNKSKPDLCLFVNSLYLTWQIWPVEKTGKWCPCWSNDLLKR